MGWGDEREGEGESGRKREGDDGRGCWEECWEMIRGREREGVMRGGWWKRGRGREMMIARGREREGDDESGIDENK